MNRTELNRQIREVGESLIKNSDKLFPGIEYSDGFSITISFSEDESPEISVGYKYVPDRYLKRKRG